MRAVLSLTAALAVGVAVVGQAPSLTVLSQEGRRTLPLTVANEQEFVFLDELASAFQLVVREESGALTVTYKNRTIVLPPDQPLASISGRLVSLPARPVRSGGRWLVPVDFINRALAPIYDVRLDLRRPAHLLIVGDLRVPRLVIRHEPLTDSARITIDATPRAASAVTQESGRLMIRFEADALDVAVPSFQSAGIVERIRVVDALTLAVDLGPRFATYRATTETVDATARLVIEVNGRAVETSAPPAAPPAPLTVELPAFGRRATPIGIVAIDAGHGGADSGASGRAGTLEKDLTLAVARRLKAGLETKLGLRVIMTRDDDRDVPLDERSAVANNNKADLLISLHANAAFKPSVRGASMYVAGFSESDEARARMSPARMPVFGGGSRDIELVPWDLAQMIFVPRSAEAARLMSAEFRGKIPLVDSPLGRAPFRVLESANMPAVLVEMGYLTNAEQEGQLASPEFQAVLAQAMVDGIVRFRDYLSAAGEER
jgi:N-acetylmuramoyl-L-alanine amidase